MCEIPNNVILIDEFAKRFDGFSIGSNDLTQLTLGVDRDSEIVAFDYDERDEGVKEMIRLAVEGCRRNGIHSGLCGQAPSDYPDMAEFLVRIGIDSMSLNPDTVIKTTRQVLELEQQLVPSLSATRSIARPSQAFEQDLAMKLPITIDPRYHDAVLFDLDGALTSDGLLFGAHGGPSTWPESCRASASPRRPIRRARSVSRP